MDSRLHSGLAVVVWVAVGLAACRGRGAPPEGNAPAAPVEATPVAADADPAEPADAATEEAPTAPPPGAPASCVTDLPAPERAQFYDGMAIGDAADTTWVVAEAFHPPQEPEPVLLWIREDGTTGVQTFEGRPAAACADGDRLRLLRRSEDPPRFWWRTVDVSNPDEPDVGPETRVRGIDPNAGINFVARAGDRVVVSYRTYQPAEAVGAATTVVLDGTTGEPVATLEGVLAWGGDCVDGSCFVLGAKPGDPGSSVTWITPDGQSDPMPASVSPGCAAQAIESDASWIAVGSAPERWMGVVVAADGTATALDVEPNSPPPSQCRLEPFPGEFGGLLEDADGRWVLHRWDPAVRLFGAPEPVARSTRFRHVFAEVGSDLAEVTWDNSSGMTHSPTDGNGMRRYYERWQFDGGEIRLLRRADGAWTEATVVPLALEPAEGVIHRGYDAFLVRRGGRVSVFLIPGGPSDPSLRQSFLAPCAP